MKHSTSGVFIIEQALKSDLPVPSRKTRRILPSNELFDEYIGERLTFTEDVEILLKGKCV